MAGEGRESKSRQIRLVGESMFAAKAGEQEN
jgi:hypothetical protein